MAAPTFVSATTLDARTGASTRFWPSHETNDIGLLFVETANEAVNLTTAATFSEITQIGVGPTSDQSATRLAVFWSRATCAAMGSPVIGDAGDHVATAILVFRGCIESGDPWDITGGDTEAGGTSAVTIPGGTTTVADCLIVGAVSNARDGGPAEQASGWANPDLTDLTERFDTNHATAGGGGFAVVTGVKASAGVFSVTTAALLELTASPQARFLVALKPPAVAASAATQWVNTLTADPGWVDDDWVSPMEVV